MNALNLGIPPAARLAGEPKASPAWEPALTRAYQSSSTFESKPRKRGRQRTQIIVPTATITTRNALALKTHLSFEGWMKMKGNWSNLSVQKSLSYHLHIKKASQRDRTHQNKKKDRKSAEVAPWLAGMVFLRFAYWGHIALIMRLINTPPLFVRCQHKNLGQSGAVRGMDIRPRVDTEPETSTSHPGEDDELGTPVAIDRSRSDSEWRVELQVVISVMGWCVR